MLVWIGSGATITKCDAADYSIRVGAAFSFKSPLRFSPELTGVPEDDLAMIAISVFRSLVFFLRPLSSKYSGRLLECVGRNSNAISWIKLRRSRNRISQFLARILNRLVTECRFALPPCFIGVANNVLRCQLSRTYMNVPGREFLYWELTFLDAVPTSNGF